MGANIRICGYYVNTPQSGINYKYTNFKENDRSRICEFKVLPYLCSAQERCPNSELSPHTAPKEALKEQVSETNRILYEDRHKVNLHGKKMSRTLCNSAQRTDAYVFVQTQGPAVNVWRRWRFYGDSTTLFKSTTLYVRTLSLRFVRTHAWGPMLWLCILEAGRCVVSRVDERYHFYLYII